MRYKANGLIWIRHHKAVSHDQIPIAARFENADQHNASSGCDTTNMQLFFPNLLHNFTNALGHIRNITNECSSTKWLHAPSHSSVIPPNFDQIYILAFDMYHAIHDCYCCMPFPSKLFTNPINMCLWEWLSSVNHFWVRVRVS